MVNYEYGMMFINELVKGYSFEIDSTT